MVYTELVVCPALQDQEVLEAIVTELSIAEQLEGVRSDLNDEEVEIARRYAQALHKAGISFVPQLLEIVGDSTADTELRSMAFRMVAWLRVPRGSSALASAFEKSDDDSFLWTVANALVRLRGEEAVPSLVRVLEQGTPSKQAAAAWVLGWLRVPSTISTLRAVMMNSHSAIDVRAHAAEALGVMQSREAVPDLITALSSESPELRYWASYSLGQIADPSGIPELERLAATETAVLPNNRSVRQEAADAIAEIRERGKESR